MPPEGAPDLVGDAIAEGCVNDEEYEGVIGSLKSVFQIGDTVAK